MSVTYYHLCFFTWNCNSNNKTRIILIIVIIIIIIIAVQLLARSEYRIPINFYRAACNADAV